MGLEWGQEGIEMMDPAGDSLLDVNSHLAPSLAQ